MSKSSVSSKAPAKKHEWECFTHARSIHFTRLWARGLAHTLSGASPAINHSWQRLQAFQPLGRRKKKERNHLSHWQNGNVRSASLSSQLLRRKQWVRLNSCTSGDSLLGLWLNGVCRCLSYQRLQSFHPVSVRGASAKSIKVSWSVSAPVVHRSARRSAKAPFAILIIFELDNGSHFPHPPPSRVHRCRNSS